MRKLLLLAALGLATVVPVRAADVTILGCNERLAGAIGVRELLADVGDTVQVAVTVHTAGDLDAYGLEVSFPTGLLSYVRTDPGELTAGWSVSQGTLKPALGVVQVDGWNRTPIPGGVSGRLAVLVFAVDAAGSGRFTTGGLVGDLVGYSPCETIDTTTKIERRTWGAVKELYR